MLPVSARVALSFVALLCACATPPTEPHHDLVLYPPGSRAAAPPAPPIFVGESYPTVVSIRQRGVDGTEVNDERWLSSGVAGVTNRFGRDTYSTYDLGLRFVVPRLKRQRVAFARLVIPAAAGARVTTGVRLRILGVSANGSVGFGERRPSEYTTTKATVAWNVTDDWAGLNRVERFKCMPLRRFSPDISPIVNELLEREDWRGSIALVIEDAGSRPGDNFLTVEDSLFNPARCRSDQSIKLELYPTLRSTFVGKELLGRITDRSVTVNSHALVAVQVFFEAGRFPGRYDVETPVQTYGPGEEIEATITGLAADNRYYYRMRYRRPGHAHFQAGPERSFHTQRPPGSTFSFVMQSDPHLQGMLRRGSVRGMRLYQRTLAKAASSGPDFLIDLGDTFHTQFFAGRDARDYDEAVLRHLDHRPFFELIGHSVPLFLVLGNHEGEQGWRLNGTAESLPVWATRARKLLYPNPAPNDFYSGDPERYPDVGQRESIYAWEWGDALFVVLDPFWHTQANPHPRSLKRGLPDPWAWTLGERQYDWFRETLEASNARFKFVFAHHVTGGLEPWKPYGRGGARAASHAAGGQGSFEWGGEDAWGRYVFDRERPGWEMPVHRVMAKSDVTIFFHGHDHCFAREEIDQIVYQAVPMPSDITRGLGLCKLARLYSTPDVRRNSGHLRVTVEPIRVTVEYVRTEAASGDEIAFRYVIYDCNRNGVVDSKDLAAKPVLDADADGILDACQADRPALR